MKIKNISTVCGQCDCYTPHIIVEGIGSCTLDGRLVFYDQDVCNKYVDRNINALEEMLEKEGFVYCHICRRPIFDRNELRHHIHGVIYKKIVMDEDFLENIYSAD
jgi:hypothetical protein